MISVDVGYFFKTALVNESVNSIWTILGRWWPTFLTSKHMFLSHYCLLTLNTPIICETDLIAIL